MPDIPRERFYMSALTEALHVAWDPSPKKSETPDFLCGLNHCTVGVEFTEFHLPPSQGRRPHQEQASLRDQIVDAAAEIYAHTMGIPLYVTVFFRDEVELRKRNVHAHAHALCDALMRTAVPRSISEPVAEVHWRELPEGISDIRIRGSIDGHDKLWQAASGGWLADIEPTHVQEILRKKARSLDKARRKCDSAWLVIVEDPFGRGAPAQISDAALSAVYETDIDLLFWLRPHVPQAWELNGQRGQGCRE